MSNASIVELDPDLIDPSFISDRLPGGDDDELLAAIRNHGQQVPIIARSHPEKPGRYQSACGHRRVRIAKSLGRSVLVLVRPLTDEELAIVQGQENSARTNLSFIERALFAHMLEERGFSRATILAALGVDKTQLSRLISAVSRTPRDLIEAVGAAPKAGLPRWTDLAMKVGAAGASERARRLIATAKFKALSTDERFVRVLEHLSESKQPDGARSELVVGDIAIGTIRRGRKTTTLEIDNTAAPAFADYLAGALDGIFTTWKSGPATGPERPRPRRKP